MTIFWTRPAEDWEEDQKIFLGNKEVVSLPLTRQTKIESQKVDAQRYAGLILTSKKALQFSNLKNGAEWTACFCVGQETADFAKQLGFGNVKTPHKTHGGLALLDILPASENPYLWLRGKDAAHDLQRLGNAKSIEIESLITYETQNVILSDKEIEKIKSSSTPHKICIASPISASVLAQYLSYFKNPSMFSIGGTTAEHLKKLGITSIQAAEPTLEKLFQSAI